MRRIAWLLLVAALVPVASARAANEDKLDATAPARNMDRPRAPEDPTRAVKLTRFVGLPADSAARGTFMEAFRAEMDAETWLCEGRDGELWAAPKKRANKFRLVDVAANETWAMDLSVRVPPEVRVTRRATPGSSLPPPRARISHVRSSRGLTIAVTVTPPRVSAGVATSDPNVFSVYFADARRVVVPSPKLPGGGYAYPWADAGRVVARAALEALHRASGGITVDERAALAPATRMDPAGAEVVP